MIQKINLNKVSLLDFGSWIIDKNLKLFSLLIVEDVKLDSLALRESIRFQNLSIESQIPIKSLKSSKSNNWGKSLEFRESPYIWSFGMIILKFHPIFICIFYNLMIYHQFIRNFKSTWEKSLFWQANWLKFIQKSRASLLKNLKSNWALKISNGFLKLTSKKEN